MKIVKIVFHWLDKNIEKVIIFYNYAICAGIIFISVIDRFLFRHQWPWSTTIPIYLFLLFSWIGCCYNVKNRTHLAFSEIRFRLPYKAQICCLLIDAVLWIFLGSIIIYYSWQQVILQYNNSSLVPGTDSLPMWLFYFSIPFSWALLFIRVIQNSLQDIRHFIKGEPFKLVGELTAD